MLFPLILPLYWSIMRRYFLSNFSERVVCTSFVPAWTVKRVYRWASLVTSWHTAVMSSSLSPEYQTRFLRLCEKRPHDSTSCPRTIESPTKKVPHWWSSVSPRAWNLLNVMGVCRDLVHDITPTPRLTGRKSISCEAGLAEEAAQVEEA